MIHVKSVEEIREAVACAEINLENLAKSVPMLDQHPLFKIVRYQLRCAQAEDDNEVPPLK